MLENLLSKIEKESQQEKELDRKNHLIEMDRIDDDEKKEVEKLIKEEEEKTDQEREKAIQDYRQEKEFEKRMKILELKKRLLEMKAKEVKKNVSLQKKKEILIKKIKESPQGKIFVYPGVKQELKEVLSSFPEVEEKEISFKDGFLIETDKFVFQASLSGLIDEKIRKDYGFLALTLFQ